MAGNHNLGTIRGTIEIDYDGAGIVRAINDTDKAKSSGEKLDGMASKVLGSFAKLTTGLLKTGGAISSVTSGLQAVAGVLAVAGPLAGAAFATAPGFIVAYASAITIAKVAVAGVGDAMAEAAEGGKKFDKALEKLSPSAQKFVKNYQAAVPVLDSVKKSIQEAFFSSLPGTVSQVTGAITKLQIQATGVARAMGILVRNAVQFATSGKSIEGVQKVLGGVRDFMYAINRSIGPVIQAFLSLAGQAGFLGKSIGGALANALAKLAVWLNSIDIKALFATALPIVQALGALLADIGSILGHFFALFTVDGASAVGVLGELVSKLAEFLDSAAGQEALTALGQAMQAIAGAAGQVFLSLLQALAPAVVALAPGVAQLAQQISGVLVAGIEFLNPLLQALAGFLSENMNWVGPLAIAVAGLAAAYKTYAAAATAVAAVQSILKARIVTTTAAWIASAAATVASTATTVANAAVTGGAAVAAWIANTAAIVANRVALVAGTVAMAAVRGAVIAWTAVQWLLNAALTANPIGLIIVAVAALIAGIILLWKNSETFRNIVLAVWSAIKVAIGVLVNFAIKYFKLWLAVAKTVLNALKSVFTTVWNFIVGYVKFQFNLIKTIITTVMNVIKSLWNAWLNGIKLIARTVWSAITSFITSQINKVKSVITTIRAVIAVVRNAFNQVLSAVRDKISAVVATVRALPGRVSSALGNIGRLLYSKGKSLIQGFINGIASMIGAVRNKVSSVVSAVTDFLPGSPAKEGPLSGKGYALLRARRMMADIAKGIDEGSGAPVKAMSGAITPMSRALSPVPSRTRSDVSTALTTPATSAAGTRTYKLIVDGKELAEFVLDVVTGQPIVVSKAANEGSRRSAWAGSGR